MSVEELEAAYESNEHGNASQNSQYASASAATASAAACAYPDMDDGADGDDGEDDGEKVSGVCLFFPPPCQEHPLGFIVRSSHSVPGNHFCVTVYASVIVFCAWSAYHVSPDQRKHVFGSNLIKVRFCTKVIANVVAVINSNFLHFFLPWKSMDL